MPYNYISEQNLGKISRLRPERLVQYFQKHDLCAEAIEVFVTSVRQGKIDDIKSLFQNLNPIQRIGLLNYIIDVGEVVAVSGQSGSLNAPFGTPIELARHYGQNNIAEFLTFQKNALEDSEKIYIKGATVGALGSKDSTSSNLPHELTSKVAEFLARKTAGHLAETGRAGISGVRIEQLAANLEKISENLLKEEATTPNQASRCLSTNSAFKLMELFQDPNNGIAYTNILLERNPDLLSPGSWAEVAKISITHANLILDNESVANNICNTGFLASIATNRPEHAKFILEKFADRLGDQKSMVESFAKMGKPDYRA